MGDEEKPQNFKDLIFLGFRSPQYTQVPDELFDLLMPRLSGAELKVLLYIVRRTFGFKKGSDRISLSQFESGITRRNGDILDSGTGLSRRAILGALQSLVEKNILVKRRVTSKEKGHESTEYALNIIGNTPSAESILGDRYPSAKNTLAPLSAENAPGLVNKVYKPLVQKVSTQETVLQQRVNNNVNVGYLKNEEGEAATKSWVPSVDELARAMVLSQDILEVFGDRKSREFYNYASLKLINHEDDVRYLMASIKQDVIQNPNSKVQNPAAIFVTHLKKLAEDRGVEL